MARRHGVAPNLLYRWRRLIAQGGAAAVFSDEPVVGNSEVRRPQRSASLHQRRSLSGLYATAIASPLRRSFIPTLLCGYST